jgi:hypothetical protein
MEIFNLILLIDTISELAGQVGIQAPLSCRHACV